jgi:hypothetical protein
MPEESGLDEEALLLRTRTWLDDRRPFETEYMDPNPDAHARAESLASGGMGTLMRMKI